MDEELEEINTEEEGTPEDTGDQAEVDPADESAVDPTSPIDWDETIADGEARVIQHFTTQPTPPYYIGDDWDNSGDLYICVANSEGVFDSDDWSSVEDQTQPTPTTTVTRYITEAITDYSAESLAEYEQSGATAWAIYDDGSRVQVQWSQVTEPQPPTVAADEALEAALANGQHFWHNSDGATTHGGAGIHVTDQTQEDWDAAVADGFSDLSDNKPYHNILINSLGMLLRTALNHLVSITRSAVAFFDGLGNTSSNVVAQFGADGAQIGRNDQSHVEIDYHSLKLIDMNNRDYFFVSDLRDRNGFATFVEHFTGNGVSTKFYVHMDIPESGSGLGPHYSPPVVEVDGVVLSNTSVGSDYNGKYVSVSTSDTPADGADVKITYMNNSTDSKAYTFGKRAVDSSIGAMSVAEGTGTVASGQFSHAEGNSTKAWGNYSHSEGYSSIARGKYSHAEGYSTVARDQYSHAEGYKTDAYATYTHVEGNESKAYGIISHAEGSFTEAHGGYSHTEGNKTSTASSANAAHAEGGETQANGLYAHSEGYKTVASGSCSHSEGADTVASGYQSHAQNLGTKSTYTASTAIGKYNDPGNFALMIGNGTADDARSNALTVDWSGNVETAGGVTSSGNVTAQGFFGTGNLELKDSTINRDGDSPSSTQNGRGVVLRDKDGERIGLLRADRSTDGRTSLNVGAFGEKSDGTEVATWLVLDSMRDGTTQIRSTSTLQLTKTTDASGTADNRPALIVGGTAAQAHLEFDSNEIMAKADGDSTATLWLNTDGGNVRVGGGFESAGVIRGGGNIVMRRPATDTSADSIDAAVYSTFGAQDANDRYIGYISIAQNTDGSCRTSLSSRRYNDGANVDNDLKLSVFPDGSRTVSLYKEPWLKALGLDTSTVTTISSIATAASGVTITLAQYAVSGKVAQLSLQYKVTAAKSGNWSICQMVTGKRPVHVSYAHHHTVPSPTFTNMSTAGVLQTDGKPVLNTTYTVAITYLLP